MLTLPCIINKILIRRENESDEIRTCDCLVIKILILYQIINLIQ